MKSKTLHIIASCARTLLALTFIFSGLVKAIDPLGTTYKIEDYLKAFGGLFTLLLPLAEYAAWTLIALEFVLGVCMLLNVRTGLTSRLTLLFYCVMTPLTLYIALRNPVSDCGCFGDALVLTNWQTFWKNVVLISLSVLLLCLHRNIPASFHLKSELRIAGGALLIVLALMTWTRLHLPLLDFRPYKIGNNIPELMEIPDDAPQPQYSVTLLYRNTETGKVQEFTLQDYPKNDPLWVFEDQKSVLVVKGYEPPIHDFEILTMDFEDITEDILYSETPVTLVIMYDLNKTDNDLMDRVADIYRTCQDRQQPFYILTGSGEEDIESFCFDICNEMGVKPPFNNPAQHFCTCDPVTLKTIVRANPGAIVLENGTIIDKYNIRNK